MTHHLTSRSTNEEIIKVYNEAVAELNAAVAEHLAQLGKEPTRYDTKEEITYLSCRETKKSYIEVIDSFIRRTSSYNERIARNKKILEMLTTDETKDKVNSLTEERDNLISTLNQSIKDATEKANEIIRNVLGSEWSIDQYDYLENDRRVEIVRKKSPGAKSTFGEEITMAVNIYGKSWRSREHYDGPKIFFNMSTSGEFAVGTTMAERYIALATLLQAKDAHDMLVKLVEDLEKVRIENEKRIDQLNHELGEYQLR